MQTYTHEDDQVWSGEEVLESIKAHLDLSMVVEGWSDDCYLVFLKKQTLGNGRAEFIFEVRDSGGTIDDFNP